MHSRGNIHSVGQYMKFDDKWYTQLELLSVRHNEDCYQQELLEL